MNKKFITKAAEETENLAKEFSREIKPGAVIALHGDLGAGKTVFSRGFARGLGITESVSSPTYTIIQEYKLPGGQWFYHLDLYRIQDSAAALAFGADEYIQEKTSISLLEWAERIPSLLPPDTIHVRIKHLSENEREITIGA
jgi:tRNA threonylcarbamoyladenosine biosynthesis protein TsaE